MQQVSDKSTSPTPLNENSGQFSNNNPNTPNTPFSPTVSASSAAARSTERNVVVVNNDDQSDLFDDPSSGFDVETPTPTPTSYNSNLQQQRQRDGSTFNNNNNNSFAIDDNNNNNSASMDKLADITFNSSKMASLLPGEIEVDRDNMVYEWNGQLNVKCSWHLGTLILTNYRIIFAPSNVSTYVSIKHHHQTAFIFFHC